MTDATWIDPQYLSRRASAETTPLPKPQPYASPIFIQDCVTPIAGETLLSIMMKRMMKDDQP